MLHQEYVEAVLNHFPLFIIGNRFGLSFDDCQEAQTTRVHLIKEKQKDKKEIETFVEKYFEFH